MHKRRYVKQELRKIVENSGYQIHKLSYFNTILSPLIILRRFLDRNLKVQEYLRNDDEIPNKFVNTILKFVFGLEKYMLPYVSMPFGISILCVAKKR
jgi:hypothetical protein